MLCIMFMFVTLVIFLPAKFHGDEILFDGFDFSLCFENPASYKHLGYCDWMNSIYNKRIIVDYSYNSTTRNEVVIADLKEKSPYVSIFQDRVLKKSIFRSKVESTVGSIADLASASLQLSYSTAISPSRSLDNDSFALSSPVPHILTNNYLLRLSNATRMAAVQENHCAAAIPRVHLVSANSSSDIFRCSSSMNTVMWMPTSPADAVVSVRIFRMDTILPPLGDGPIPPATNTADNEPSLSQSDVGPDDHDSDGRLEEPCRDLQRFCPNDPSSSSPATNHCTVARAPTESPELFFAESTLRSGEYLFVPHGFAVSLQASPGRNAEDPRVLSSCLVDASNLVSFEDSLRASASAFDATLLREVRSGAVDLALDRHPAELLLRDYLQVLAGMRAISASADASALQQQQASQSQQRDRRKRGRNDFKDWQDAVNWISRVTALTLPRLAAPRLLVAHRTAAAFELPLLFVPAASDRTAFGLLLQLCEVDLTGQAAVSAAAERSLLEDSSNIVATKSCTQHRVLWGDAESIQMKDVSSMASSSSPPSFSLRLSALRPGTVYQMSVRLFYDRAEGPTSLWCRPFRTTPMSPPSEPLPLAMFSLTAVGGARSPSDEWFSGLRAALTLESQQLVGTIDFTKPTDDGGEEIAGYHVFSRHLSQSGGVVQAPSEWTWRGAFKAAVVDANTLRLVLKNFKPDVAYEFKVSAYNILGNSSLSEPSNAVLYWPLKQVASLVHLPITVFGIDHQSYYAGKTMVWDRFAVPKAGDGSLFQISDNGGVISSIRPLAQPTMSFEVWGCHWGLSVDEIVARGAIVGRAEDSVFERIAFVKRGGGEPLAVKVLSAQRRGAVAVVVVDDGRCRAYDQSCLPGATLAHGDRFAMEDQSNHWEGVTVPSYFMLLEHAEALWSATYAQEEDL